MNDTQSNKHLQKDCIFYVVKNRKQYADLQIKTKYIISSKYYILFYSYGLFQNRCIWLKALCKTLQNA